MADSNDGNKKDDKNDKKTAPVTRPPDEKNIIQGSEKKKGPPAVDS